MKPCLKKMRVREAFLHFNKCLNFVMDKENWYGIGIPEGSMVDFLIVTQRQAPQRFPLADGIMFEVLLVSDLGDGRLLGRNPYWVLVSEDLDADLVETIRRRVASRFMGATHPAGAFPCVIMVDDSEEGQE